MAHLDDLVSQGREEEALRHVPRERAGARDEPGAMIYGRTGSGGFVLRADVDGDIWEPDWPVIMVDWHGAVAYCHWLAGLTGKEWRLPWEMEWSKAARGVDGRWYPWGSRLDPSWCCMRDSHEGRALPAVVDSYPLDISPYGVRGLGGNSRDWCLDVYAGDLGFRAGPPRWISTASTVIPPLRNGSPDVEGAGSKRVERGGSRSCAGWKF